MTKLLLILSLGGGLGAATGYYGQCTSGTCPLTSTWYMGAVFGTLIAAALFTARA